VLGIDYDKVIPDASKTLAQGAIRPWRGRSTSWERSQLKKFCARRGIPTDRPWEKLGKAAQRAIVEGDGDWEGGKFPGLRAWFAWLETRTYKMHVRVFLSRYRSYDECPRCQGRRLNERALGYRVADLTLADWYALEVSAARRLLEQTVAQSAQGALARRELASRLSYLERVGLGYLTLDRQARTLSGGEAQRVTLTAALGTSLHNALFVLDEPTVGLHPRDVASLNELTAELAARNNVVLVIEHDADTIARAHRVVELGPGAGTHGGRVVADGAPSEVAKAGGATARALQSLGPRTEPPREPNGWLSVRGARANNLKGLDVNLPLGVVCAVTGPSGSGKTTLVENIVFRALARRLGELDVEAPGEHDGIDGAERIRSVALVDQSPLGRTSRGNAATYTKAWDAVRAAFAREPAATAHGLGPSHFSFNVAGGRCDACSGDGSETVEMQFLADVRLSCPVCRGRRFKDDVLSVRHRGLNVAELLGGTVEAALEHFRDFPAVVRALKPVSDLGLGYLALGQSLSTLSGGEAQRLKLARALSSVTPNALFVLDEPSAGLHADEVERLLAALDTLVQAGASVLVVEHDLSVVWHADWVVDMGPDAGRNGGRVMAAATPAALSRADTATASALRERLSENGALSRAQGRKAAPARSRAELSVVRAREHNLRDVSCAVPHGMLTVVTGPSGSGKSTLAFDVVFAEGQRRFLETLSPYARQFLPVMPRPDVDDVVGVPPALALEQRTARAGARSTVATVTEVAHYLRLLYAKLGEVHCPEHDRPIQNRSPDQLFAELRARRGRFTLLAPAVRARKGTYLDVFAAAARDGIEKAYCDGELVGTESPPRLVRSREHDIDLVLGENLAPKELDRALLERALGWGHGAVKLLGRHGSELWSQGGSCPICGLSVPELDPRFFSFNTKQGRCERCDGYGYVERARRNGTVDRERCTGCDGTRLNDLCRAVRVKGHAFGEIGGRSVSALLALIDKLRFGAPERPIAEPIVAELTRRLRFLSEVGLDYLALERAADTLSGGELQRLRLAAQLGAGLTGALYVLDEPTIGLHPRDTGRLLGNLRRLVELGSTVLVVEHDEETIAAADHLIDLGPAGGSRGGEVIAEGSPKEVLRLERSPTGRALSARPELRKTRAPSPLTPWLELDGASAHNLKEVDVRMPVGRFTVVAGVSGSGKSTLVQKVLLPAVRKKLRLATPQPGAFRRLGSLGGLTRALSVDQSPIGRTPRSVPATFLGIWDAIRRLFAATAEARALGFQASRFSFNTPAGGRCTECAGQGAITHEMSFLPDVVTACPSCGGGRFEPETLAVRCLGLTIADVLHLTAEEAARVFERHSAIAAPLATLADLGAGYIALGQGSHTLSGGEAQRLKLAAELCASARHTPTLYVLDEPTTGLHLADVEKLMNVLGRLIERGDTLVVIEHHPQVIAGADWVLELGPEGGEGGGRIVAQGTPAEVARAGTPTGAVIQRARKRAAQPRTTVVAEPA
jgi:excinuclease ABC subunit A